MKAFLCALIAIVVVSTAAWLGLESAGFSTATRTTADTVRLD